MQNHPSAHHDVPNVYPEASGGFTDGLAAYGDPPLEVDRGIASRRHVDRRTLTDKALAALKPARDETRYTIQDGRTGLAVRVTDKGERSWIVRPLLGGSRFLLTLGTYPETTLEEARALARGALQAAADGVDPRPFTRERLRAIADGEIKPRAIAHGEDPEPTFGDLAEKFLASPAVTAKPSEKETKRIITAYFLSESREGAPAVNWKNVPMGDLDGREINGALELLVKRGRVQANHCAQTLNRLFRWAAKTSRLRAVPVFDTKPGGEEHERQREITPNELRAIWKASAAEPVFGPYVRFVLATGLRRDEAASALRTNLDQKAKTLRVTVKGGREFMLPLNRLALDAIKAAPKNSDDYIFSASGKPLNAWSKMMARLRTASGTAGWTLHDARRTLRTGLAVLKVADEIAERCLAHVVGGRMTRTYNRHEYLDEKRAALDRWAKRLEEITRKP